MKYKEAKDAREKRMIKLFGEEAVKKYIEIRTPSPYKTNKKTEKTGNKENINNNIEEKKSLFSSDSDSFDEDNDKFQKV